MKEVSHSPLHALVSLVQEIISQRPSYSLNSELILRPPEQESSNLEVSNTWPPVHFLWPCQ